MAPRVADGGTGSGLNTIVNGYSKISSEPFSATYHLVDREDPREREHHVYPGPTKGGRDISEWELLHHPFGSHGVPGVRAS